MPRATISYHVAVRYRFSASAITSRSQAALGQVAGPWVRWQDRLSPGEPFSSMSLCGQEVVVSGQAGTDTPGNFSSLTFSKTSLSLLCF